MKKIRTIDLILCALCAALSAILSQVSIPIGPVPINLAHVSIFLAAGLLGPKYGTISQVIFVLLGALGVPVFSGFRGGVSVLIGPTGGFIIGYIICVFVTGFIIEKFGRVTIKLVLAMYAGWVVTYACGVAWFMYSMQATLAYTLSVCVLPFLIGDVIKTALCVVLIKRLHVLLNRAQSYQRMPKSA